ncbi:MAG TPA: helix-turn-helix domain-containing protein [Anaerovoracaceae bacterium]|nr:helix-turn-helix domain-containing protein [Anaerovoracaceae bacterium]
MSYIISEKQYLASDQKKIQYVPYKIRIDSFRQDELEVPFGHPLYTFVADFLEISPNLSLEKADLYNYPVIPDGCVSIVLVLRENGIQGYLCGVIDELHKIALCEGETAFIARYFPGGFRPLTREPISTYTNCSCSLSKVLPNYQLIFSAFARASAFSERVLAFSKPMRSLYLDNKEVHYVMNYCIDKIYRQNGNVKVSDLSRETGFSERYIGKLFDRWVGISPKLYAEIMRFQFSLEKLKELEHKEGGILLDTALDSGFFDHAHMNRCYQRFLHCTAGTLNSLGFEGLDLSNVTNIIG